MTKEEDQFIHILNLQYNLLENSVGSLNNQHIELDLGCGKGGFSSKLAERFPEYRVLAADVMIGRLRKLVKRNKRMKLDNVNALRVEARHLIGYMLPDCSVDRLHILCPDPWPKDRHKHQRLLCSDFIAKIYRVLKNDGAFHFASDDDYYFGVVKTLMSKSGIFKRDDAKLDDIMDLKTDFEIRWLDMGRTVQHGAWIKK